MSQYQKGKTNLDFTEARDSEWQYRQLDHMQVCTSLQTDNHASTPPLSFLQAGCPSCRPTNSVRALKAQNKEWGGEGTETATKKCKTEKLKSKNVYARSNSKSLGNNVVSPEKEKERLQWEGSAEKEGFKSGLKEREGDGKLQFRK